MYIYIYIYITRACNTLPRDLAAVLTEVRNHRKMPLNLREQRKPCWQKPRIVTIIIITVTITCLLISLLFTSFHRDSIRFHSGRNHVGRFMPWTFIR